MLQVISNILESVAAGTFPASCYGCGRVGRYLCVNCAKYKLLHIHQPICIICQRESASGGIHQECKQYSYLDDFYSVCRSSPIIDKMLHDGKYKFYYRVYKDLARLIAVKAQEWNLGDAMVAWAPQSDYRTKWRGFNQARVLAEEFAVLTGRRAVDVFERRHNPVNQVGLKRESRLQNLRNQISIREGVGELVKGRGLILIDDVFTTGATLQECGKVFKGTGGGKLTGITILRV